MLDINIIIIQNAFDHCLSNKFLVLWNSDHTWFCRKEKKMYIIYLEIYCNKKIKNVNIYILCHHNDCMKIKDSRKRNYIKNLVVEEHVRNLG